MTHKPAIVYYSGTHWDREWYQSYQGFRYILTDMMNDLIGYLEDNPDVGPFHLDGQTIILDDYLEIKPEMRQRLVRLLQSGRILAGPWYCAPDEHLISGESLIRNLQKGFSVCAQMGIRPWRVSNLCDGFGHMSQMPQLLRAFGLDAAIVGRGTNEHSAPAAFIWEAPDGSRVTALRPPDQSGYGSFSMDVCGQARKGTLRTEVDGAFRSDAKAYADHEFSRSNGEFAVIWDAMDHEPVHHAVPGYLKALKELYPDAYVRQGDLYDIFSWVGEHCPSLPVWQGEMLEFAKKDGLFLHLLIHKLSSRQSIKSTYDQCESRLVEIAEPICAWMKRHAMADNARFLDLAWEYLLKNSIHDTICGCSVDRVHNDTKYRFAQVHEICDIILQSYQNTLSGNRFILSEPEEYMIVANPWPVHRDGVCRIVLPFAPEYPTWHEPFGYEEIADFTLWDEKGSEIPYAIRSIHRGRQLRGMGEKRLPVNLYEIDAELTFLGQQARSVKVTAGRHPVRTAGGIARRNGTLENEWLTVTVENNGTLSVTDKVTGCAYRELCELVDDGEIGDGWNHVSPANDAVVLGGAASAAIEHNSAMSGTIRVVKTLRVPASIADRAARQTDGTDLRCVFTYTLAKGERRLRVNLSVDNTASDHRLKLRVPTGVAGKRYVTDDNFAFITRSGALDEATYAWKECDKPERPMRGVAFRRDASGNGLAFVSRHGLHECACVDDALEITLLRCFADTFADQPETGGQELFEHEYEFSLVPLDAGVKDISLLQLQQEMNVPLFSFPSLHSLDLNTMQVLGDVCVSAFGEDFIRVYNPTGQAAAFSLHSSLPFANAAICDLRGREIAPLSVREHRIQATVEPMKIMTISFQTQSRKGELNHGDDPSEKQQADLGGRRREAMD